MVNVNRTDSCIVGDNMKTLYKDETYTVEEREDVFDKKFQELQKNVDTIGQALNDNTYDLNKKIEGILNWIEYFRNSDPNGPHPADRLRKLEGKKK